MAVRTRSCRTGLRQLLTFGAAASAGGEIFVRGARESHLSTVTAALREAGCQIRPDAAGIACVCRERAAGSGTGANGTVSRLSHRCPGDFDGRHCCAAGGRRYLKKISLRTATAMWTN